jgi:hypothetical protein
MIAAITASFEAETAARIADRLGFLSPTARNQLAYCHRLSIEPPVAQGAAPGRRDRAA